MILLPTSIKGGVLNFIVSLRSNKIGMFQKIRSFLQESRQEFKRIYWPTFPETRRLTLIVIGLSLAVAIFLGFLDFIFTRLLNTFFVT